MKDKQPKPDPKLNDGIKVVRWGFPSEWGFLDIFYPSDEIKIKKKNK